MLLNEDTLQYFLEVQNLYKAYGDTQCLEGLSFHVKPGELIALLGPNGAGKSTTFSCIMGLKKADSGKIYFFNHEKFIPLKISCTPQESDFPPSASVSEILDFVAKHYTSPLNREEIIDDFCLETFLNKPISILSGGQKRCLGLACAFIGNTDLVLLDEPTVGLDVDVRQKLWRVLQRKTKQGKSILLSTHYLDEAEEIADRILVLHKGKVLKEGTASEIKRELGFSKISFQASDIAKLKEYDFISQGENHKLVTQNTDKVIRELVEKKVDFHNLEVHNIRLEEAFLKLLEKEQ